jgi:hypothetical protein
MGSWLGWNILLGLMFVGCWAGIPLWLTLTRWKDEVETQHAEIAMRHAWMAARNAEAAHRAAADLALATTGSPR